MDEGHLAAFDRQTNSGAAACLRQRPDDPPERLDTIGVAHDGEPFFELAVHVPARRLQVVEAGATAVPPGRSTLNISLNARCGSAK